MRVSNRKQTLYHNVALWVLGTHSLGVDVVTTTIGTLDHNFYTHFTHGELCFCAAGYCQVKVGLGGVVPVVESWDRVDHFENRGARGGKSNLF